MRRLILFRHGKSDWHASYGTDHERPLNRRGVRAAETMGRVLERAGLVPDHAITSSALRAKSTLELASTSGGWACTVEVSDELYGTTADAALKVAARTATEVESLMLVGHEPTWSELCRHLTGGSVAVKTATVLGIDLPIASWKDVDTRASLAFLLQPRLFTDWIGGRST